MSGDFPFQPDGEERVGNDPGEGEGCNDDIGDEVAPERFLEKLFHQRSTSPRTISVLPVMATTSAIIEPRQISGMTLRLTNEGERALTRNGLVDPSLMI